MQHLQAYYVVLLYLITELYESSDTVQHPFGQHNCKIHDDDDNSGKSQSGVRSSRTLHMAFKLPF